MSYFKFFVRFSGSKSVFSYNVCPILKFLFDFLVRSPFLAINFVLLNLVQLAVVKNVLTGDQRMMDCETACWRASSCRVGAATNACESERAPESNAAQQNA